YLFRIFFFSSRRRHTRSKRDWSSDVCSSDLFALAQARYSQLESWLVHDGDRSPERRNKARSLAERALQLQPDLPEAHLALGLSYYYGDKDYDAALRELEIVRR